MTGKWWELGQLLKNFLRSFRMQIYYRLLISCSWRHYRKQADFPSKCYISNSWNIVWKSIIILRKLFCFISFNEVNVFHSWNWLNFGVFKLFSVLLPVDTYIRKKCFCTTFKIQWLFCMMNLWQHSVKSSWPCFHVCFSIFVSNFTF